jgi:hypothetical protein
MLGYTNFFRQSSSREEGWLETQMGRGGTWLRKFVVFDDGALTLADSPEAAAASIAPVNNNFADAEYVPTSSSSGSSGAASSSGSGNSGDVPMKIPMDHVISLRTDDQYGNTVIQIVTTDGKLLIRAESKEDMRRWLFCFQKSVALVLSRLLLQTPPSAASSSSVTGGGRGGTSTTDDDYDLSASGRSHCRSRDRGGAGLGSHLWLSSNPHPHAAPSSSSSSSSSSGGGIGGGRPGVPGDKMWLAELGHGHGKHSYLARKRNNFAEHKTSPGGLFTRSLGDGIADAVADAAGRVHDGHGAGAGAGPGPGRALTVQRSVLDLARLNVQDAGLQIDRRLMISGSGGGSRDQLQHDDIVPTGSSGGGGGGGGGGRSDAAGMSPSDPHTLPDTAHTGAARSPAIPISVLSASAGAGHAQLAAARLASSYESGDDGILSKGGLGLTPRTPHYAPQPLDDEDDDTPDASATAGGHDDTDTRHGSQERRGSGRGVRGNQGPCASGESVVGAVHQGASELPAEGGIGPSARSDSERA